MINIIMSQNMKSAFVLKIASTLFAHFLILTATAKTQLEVYGKGMAQCEDGLGTLSVARENLLQTKADWDAFVEKNPLFVVGAADSSCKACCDSEPLLRDLELMVKEKSVLSFPEKHKK